MSAETKTETRTGVRASSDPRPGVVVLFSGGQARCTIFDLPRSGSLVIGRGSESALALPDERLSREHVAIAFDGKKWTIKDLGSRNGTFVDGDAVTGSIERDAPPIVIRAADTLLVLHVDTTPFQDVSLGANDDPIAGPQFRAALGDVARAKSSLLLIGETGSGKEIAARWFHAHPPTARSGPFVAVNCATIPEGVAERLLFGSVRGAYSGANDAPGHVQSADGGTLFLDEIGELDPAVQAKLLRFVETREAMPVGASITKKVDVRLVFATNRDLRAAIAEDNDDGFRPDLYYRIADPCVILCPLRDRVEEIPWHVARAAGDRRATARFVEACMKRAWLGNVRELRAAVQRALTESEREAEEVLRSRHLAAEAGVAPASATRSAESIAHADLEAALAKHDGNVSAAARELGLFRTQLYRAMKRYGIAARS